MAIDPNILLQYRGPDIGGALLKGLQGVSAIQSMQQAAAEAPLRQQALEQAIQAKQYEADLLKAGVAASRLKRFIANKDYTGFKTQLQREGLDQKDMDMLDTYARANRWDELGGIADQFIQTARDSGVFQRDYAAAGAGGYTPSAVQLFEYRKKLVEQGDEAALREFDNIVKTSQMIPGGGNTTYARNPITGKTELIDVTGGAGAGGPKLTSKDLPPGAVIDQSRSGRNALTPDEFADYLISQGVDRETAEAIRNAGRGGAVTPDKLPIPKPGGKPATQAEMEQPVGDSAAVIRRREGELAAAKRYGEQSAKNIAELENTADLFEVNKAGFDDAYPQVKLGEILAKAPDSRIGQIFSQGIGNFLQGIPSVNADFELGQAFRAAVGLIPFPPGAQSQAEQDAREKEVGNLIDAKVSKEVRIKSMERLLNREQAKSKKRWDIVNRKRKEVGLPEVTNPFEKMKKEPSAANDVLPAAGGSNINRALEIIRRGQQ